MAQPIQKTHIYRHSDTSLFFCGAALEPVNPVATRVPCEDCEAAQRAKRASQARSAKQVLEASKDREAALSSSASNYDAWMRGE